MSQINSPRSSDLTVIRNIQDTMQLNTAHIFHSKHPGLGDRCVDHARAPSCASAVLTRGTVLATVCVPSNFVKHESRRDLARAWYPQT
eukprot:6203713-Pleurochrysis_carterae.AAC.2